MSEQERGLGGSSDLSKQTIMKVAGGPEQVFSIHLLVFMIYQSSIAASILGSILYGRMSSFAVQMKVPHILVQCWLAAACPSRGCQQRYRNCQGSAFGISSL